MGVVLCMVDIVFKCVYVLDVVFDLVFFGVMFSVWEFCFGFDWMLVEVRFYEEVLDWVWIFI